MFCSRLLLRSSTVATPDGKEIKLTPEMLTIERKTFKQSSEYKSHYVHRCMAELPHDPTR